MTNLRRLAHALDLFEVQVQGKFVRLRADLAVLIEAEERPKTESSDKSGQLKKQRPRWTGPASPEVHKTGPPCIIAASAP